MRLSKSFLNDYVKVDDLDFHELAEKMVFCGNEYESIETLSDATGLVVGEVVECIDHPESDHLHICQVNTGEEVKQIICGAPNVRAGLKVIVATVGAKLPGGIVIKKAKLAGMESNGMICSLEELGIDSKYLKDEDKEGIHELPLDAEVGVDAIKYLGFDDEAIDFELTADRADLMSVLGMAYEVGAIYDRKVTYPETEVETIDEDVSTYHSLNVETEDCPIYLGRMVKDVTVKESPQWLKNRLMSSGIRPINNVVDISNYVMLEFGQPLHFFDSDNLGKEVIVRNAKENEEIVTLDGNKRVLNTNDLVIASSKEAVCLNFGTYHPTVFDFWYKDDNFVGDNFYYLGTSTNIDVITNFFDDVEYITNFTSIRKPIIGEDRKLDTFYLFLCKNYKGNNLKYIYKGNKFSF